MKKCFKCGGVKSLDCFYKHSKMADGHLNKCKECTKRDVTEHYFDNHERMLKYNRVRSRKPECVERRKKYAAKLAEEFKADPEKKMVLNIKKKEWIKKNTVKRAAHIIVNNAVRDGRLIRQPCQVCGIEKSEAHHENYEKPLDVMWLCKKHHTETHLKPIT